MDGYPMNESKMWQPLSFLHDDDDGIGVLRSPDNTREIVWIVFGIIQLLGNILQQELRVEVGRCHDVLDLIIGQTYP